VGGGGGAERRGQNRQTESIPEPHENTLRATMKNRDGELEFVCKLNFMKNIYEKRLPSKKGVALINILSLQSSIL
jgi:hypothetical protein